MNTQSQDNFSQKIEELNTDYGNTLNEVNYNVFKNDQNYGQRLKELKVNISKTDESSVGLIVGPGALFSSLPEFPCQSIIVCDYNDFVIDTTKHIQSVFEDSDFVTEFISKLYSDRNPYFAQIIDKYGPQTFHEFRDTQIEALDNMHVEYSQLRFFRCKQAYQQKNIWYLKIDFNDGDRVRQVAGVMQNLNKTITFADFSNVHQCTGSDIQKYGEGLKFLPFSFEALIFYSKGLDGNMLETQPICTGLDEYMKQI